VIALVLRLVGLNQGLWFDEMVTLVESVRPPLATILTVFPGYNNHPLYSVTAHVAVTTLGEHAWSVRLPAVLFGVASIPALFWLGLTVSDRREALGATALVCVSYHHVWFSQNARGYTALLFWTLIATTALLKGLQDGRSRWYVLHGIAVALGLYTHLTMGFVAAAHGVIWAALVCLKRGPSQRRVDWHGPALAIVVALVLTTVLYGPMLPQVYSTVGGPPPATREVATPTWAAMELLRGLRIGFGALGVLAGLFLAGLGALAYLRRQPIAFAAFTLPVIVTGAGILALHFSARPRFFFGLAGFAVLFLVRGAAIVGDAAAARLTGAPARATAARAGTVLIAAIVAASAFTLPRAYALPKQDFDGALRFIDANRAGGEPVITAGLARYPYRRFYGRDWTQVQTTTDLRRLETKPAWVVYSFPEYMEPDLVDTIRRHCGAPRVFPGTLGGGDVVVCKLEGWAAASPGTGGPIEALPATGRARSAPPHVSRRSIRREL
jgi:4-amino-4-deoxy-L-arabinose transferase-like glycosyltransferase